MEIAWVCYTACLGFMFDEASIGGIYGLTNVRPVNQLCVYDDVDTLEGICGNLWRSIAVCDMQAYQCSYECNHKVWFFVE